MDRNYLDVADLARCGTVFKIEHPTKNIDERAIWCCLGLASHRLVVLMQDVFLARDQLSQALTLRPSELPALHRLVFVVDLVLVRNGLLEQVRMLFGKTDPFVLALEEAEETAGARS